MWSSYDQNIKQFLTWMIGHWRQRRILQTSSGCNFYHAQFTTIWGIWSWMKFQIFLRLMEMKENSPLCRFISANRSYNLRNLNLKWGPTVPQIVGYKWKFLTLHVFSARKSYKLWNLWIWIETRIFLRLKVIRENSPVCRIFVQWNPTIWGINVSFWREVVTIKIQNSLYHEW